MEGTKLVTTSGTIGFRTLIYLLVFTFVVWYIQYHWKRRKMYAFASKINGPYPLPLVGNALMFLGANLDILSKAMKLTAAYKSPIRIWLGQKLYFAIWKPEQLEIVLNQALEKDELYKQTEPVVGTGLFTASVPKWKRHKKIILPAFNQKILDNFVEVFSERSEILVEQLQKHAGKETFDIMPFVSRCTLDIFCETAMGVTVNAQTTDCDYVKWIDKGMQIVFTRMILIWYRNDFIFNRSSMAKEFYKVVNNILNFSGSVVKEKRLAYYQEMKINKERPAALIEDGSKRRQTFLDLLIKLSEEENANFTDEELREEVNTFMIGGSETTASADSFVFLMLGMFPNVQEKVYNEILDILGPDRSIESRDLVNLVYLERVIKETLRILPVGPLLLRAVTEDIKLEHCTLPAGSGVVITVIALHRDPDIWPDPLKFDPDRFLPEEMVKRHPYSWLPFCGGTRHCVGTKYAMMAMKTLIATVIRKYRFSTAYESIEDIKLKDDFTLKPVDGFKVSIELRT